MRLPGSRSLLLLSRSLLLLSRLLSRSLLLLSRSLLLLFGAAGMHLPGVCAHTDIPINRRLIYMVPARDFDYDGLHQN